MTKPKRILICGSRDFSNRKALEDIMESFSSGDVIIQGGAKGADALAKQIAQELGRTCLEFQADWEKHGKAAGPIRNSQMLEEGKPDVVYAFYTEPAKSKGTKDMVKKAKEAGIPVYEYNSKGELISRSALPTSYTISNTPDNTAMWVEKVEFKTHCPLCKAEYINVQHPLKGPGVIGQRLCKCKFISEEVRPGVTEIKQVPPK